MPGKKVGLVLPTRKRSIINSHSSQFYHNKLFYNFEKRKKPLLKTKIQYNLIFKNKKKTKKTTKNLKNMPYISSQFYQ